MTKDIYKLITNANILFGKQNIREMKKNRRCIMDESLSDKTTNGNVSRETRKKMFHVKHFID